MWLIIPSFISVVLSRFMQGIEQQFLALQKGIHELIPQNSLKPFDERELELVSVTLSQTQVSLSNMISSVRLSEVWAP